MVRQAQLAPSLWGWPPHKHSETKPPLFQTPLLSLPFPHIVGPCVQPSKALRVSAADTLDIHLQDQLKPWPQQGKHLLPVPVGLFGPDQQAKIVRMEPGGETQRHINLSSSTSGEWLLGTQVKGSQITKSGNRSQWSRARSWECVEVQGKKGLSDLSRAGTSLLAAMLRNRRTMWMQRNTAMAS